MIRNVQSNSILSSSDLLVFLGYNYFNFTCIKMVVMSMKSIIIFSFNGDASNGYLTDSRFSLILNYFAIN